ncbi:MAG: DUF2066 domain-containing protein [Alphaproteobacteria bacterium]|jgi:hypothetical protein|nr:DUF2066 domain-containing protein [Alphaproteobacteria bacterium]MBT7943263.1 DUF2066 domain-containing protein [Alphaproteobacteria bacterium]
MTEPRKLQSVALVVLALIVTLVLSAGAIAKPTQKQNVFEVRDVAVDVTADAANQARAQALAKGKTGAFQRLLERLTLRIEHPGLPKLTPKEIDSYVNDFSVSDEKTSSVRYLARLTFRFKPKEIRGLLNDSGFSFAETVSKPVLVLPVYQAAGALILWDDPNPWRDAWAAREKKQGLVPTNLPLGDLADIAAIGAEQAMDGDLQRLHAIAARYGASDTLVVFGVLRVDAAKARQVLDVYFTRFGRQLQEQTEVVSFPQGAGETVPQLLARAAVEMTYVVEDNWKRDNLLQFSNSGVLPVVLSISGLKDWIAVRARLSGVAVIRRSEMVLLSKEEVRLNLHFFGDTNQLALALEQADLKLAQDEGKWVLAPTGTKPQ